MYNCKLFKMKPIHSIRSVTSLLVAFILTFSAAAQTVDYTHNGATVKLRKIEINAGAEEPFTILHISDSHLALAEESDGVRKMDLAEKRGKTFKKAEAMLRAHREYAKENDMLIVHSGDMMDFVSKANLDCIKDLFSEGEWLACAGNHEYSLYVGEAKEDDAYRAKSYDKVQAVFPNDLTFFSRVINGVNFVLIDNGYYKFTKDQFSKMKQEVKKGLPIILICHNPLYTPDMCEFSLNKAKGKYAGLVGVPREITDTYASKPRPAGQEWRNRSIQQRADKTTLKFCKWLKSQKQLKAILTGHCHFYYTTQFSPTATQFTVGCGYRGAGYIVDIK